MILSHSLTLIKSQSQSKSAVTMFRFISLIFLAFGANSFVTRSPFVPRRFVQACPPLYETVLTRIPEEEEGVPIPFVDNTGNSFIECYADSVANIDGVDFTIGVPSDYCVALCYFEDENLIPVELNDKLMDDIFPVAENIVAEEFGDELVLQRTPQTLTLVGELEEDEEDEEDEDEDEDDEDDDDDEMYDGEEEVEVLLTFEHRGTEFNLVRLMDPVLLVGKTDPERPGLRLLLSPEESDQVMPKLEELFLKYHDERDSMLP